MRHIINELEIDTQTRMVLRSGVPEVFQKRLLTLLIHFVERPHQLISKEELFRDVWHGRPVEESVIANAIWQLRTKLGDSDKKMFRSFSGRGYMFVPVDSAIGLSGEGKEDAERDTELFADSLSSTSVKLEGAEIPPMPVRQSRSILNHAARSSRQKKLAISLAIACTVGFFLLYISSKNTNRNMAMVVVQADNSWTARYLESEINAFEIERAEATFDASGLLRIATPVRRYTVDLNNANLEEFLQSNFRRKSSKEPLEQNLEAVELMLLNSKSGQFLDAEMASIAEGPGLRPDTLAFISYALNENSNKQPATLIARNLLRNKPRFKHPLTRCLVQFVDQDSSDSPIQSDLADCPVAQTRKLERALKFNEVRRVLDSQTKIFPLIAGKMLEIQIRMELLAGNQSQALDDRLSYLIDATAKSNEIGWHAKLLEFKGWRFAASYQLPQAIELFEQSIALLDSDRYQIPRRRLQLVMARLKPQLSVAERLMVQKELALAQTATLRLCALLAARKHKITHDSGQYFNEVLSLVGQVDSLIQDHAFRALTAETVRENLPEENIRVAETWIQYKKDYPTQSALVKTNLAQAYFGRGLVTKSLQQFQESSKVLPVSNAQSFACIAGFVALEAQEPAVAVDFFSRCSFENASPESPEYCLDFFKYAGLALADQKYVTGMISYVKSKSAKLMSASVNCGDARYAISKAIFFRKKNIAAVEVLSRIITGKSLPPYQQVELEFQWCLVAKRNCQAELENLKAFPFQNRIERLRAISVWLPHDCDARPADLPAEIAQLGADGALETADTLSKSCQNRK